MVSINMQKFFFIPCGVFASDDDAVAKAKREELRQKLLGGDTITLNNDGSATNGHENNSTIIVPKGKLADDDAVAKAKREELRKKLLGGDTITLKNDGSATDNQSSDSTISIPKGKLAAQWYETNPQLLALERIAMQKAFPNFKLEKLDDGRLSWIGKLHVGVYETKFHQPMEYHVMALYMNNHPYQQMGSSVRVYPILPNVKELVDKLGFRPLHLLQDSDGELYLCTNEYEDQRVGNDVSSAASVLGWACKWLLAYELVLTGELSEQDFNTHGRI